MGSSQTEERPEWVSKRMFIALTASNANAKSSCKSLSQGKVQKVKKKCRTEGDIMCVESCRVVGNVQQS